jgi:hypothetical protein
MPYASIYPHSRHNGVTSENQYAKVNRTPGVIPLGSNPILGTNHFNDLHALLESTLDHTTE